MTASIMEVTITGLDKAMHRIERRFGPVARHEWGTLALSEAARAHAVPAISAATPDGARWVLSAALMLYSAKNEVLSTRIWIIWLDGKVPMVCALSSMMIAFIMIISSVRRKIAQVISQR